MTLIESRRLSHQRTSRVPAASLFNSFWMGGFESACQINTVQRRIDMIAATQHDALAEQDYAMMRNLNIRTVRDGLRWHLIERTPGQYDFSSFVPMLRAAQRQGVQVIWNLCHYGWPDDLDFFSAAFVDRFTNFVKAVARLLAGESSAVQIVCPINEMSFLAWAIGHKGIIYPYALGRAHEAKQQIIRATIAAIEALWEVDPRTRIASIDPIIRVVCPVDRPDLEDCARGQHNAQYDAWDMLTGRSCPELGGREKYLDLMGINYYHSNQFEHPDVRLRWEDNPRDERFVPFHTMLQEVYDRYGRTMFVAETSHFGCGRALWLHEITEEILTAKFKGLPVEGLCLYPIIDRPDWENPDHWHNSGIIDLVRDSSGNLQRVPHNECIIALRHAQKLFAQHGWR